jgi:polyhydroxyalkanoate synthase subunit PhaC
MGRVGELDATQAESAVTVSEEPVPGGEPVGFPSLADVGDGLAASFGHGRTVLRQTARLGAELANVLLGQSDLTPGKGDRRFGDPAWSTNPFFRRLEQGYLAWSETLEHIVDEAEASGEDHRRVERARFTVNVLTSALAPTNFFATNPAAIKRAFDTGGASLVRGARHFVSDLRNNGGMPSQVDPDAFEVGRDLAITPGAVIARDEVAEVLQYVPTTETVAERPVLVVPPPIGRYYFLDLQPGRSFVEFAVNQGLQTFLVSWRNPAAEQGHWDLDTYAARVSRAIDTVCEVTGSPDVNLIGFCAGGIISTTLLNHMVASGDVRVHSASYAVTLLDFDERAPIAAFSGRNLLGFARRRTQRTGIISSRQMGAAFLWMRPNDLVFNYWVNNYLMGDKPPSFDILAWNADGTNLPGALHCQFLDIFQANVLVRPEAISVLGTPLQFETIKVPTFVTGAIADHLTPWKGCYRTTQLLSGESTFVLSYSGHIASLINPPGNPKAYYWTGGVPGPDPDAWLSGAEKHTGSWWEAWAEWVGPRGGDQRDAPTVLGSSQHPPLDPAPGRFVRDLTG